MRLAIRTRLPQTVNRSAPLTARPGRPSYGPGQRLVQGTPCGVRTKPAGVQATTALVSGEVQGAVGFYAHTLDLQVKGKHMESVVQFSHAPGEVEVVSDKAAGDITFPKDFKGKKFGSTGLGSSTDFLTRYLAVNDGCRQ
jgi:NitT/TauT family transport system substrate-binding protein